MIERLTLEQEASLASVRDEWVAHGLSVAPADREAAEQGIRAAYRAGGLDPPRFIIWLGSPWAGVIGQAIAPGIISGENQVVGQVDEQVGSQVRGQVYGQVAAQVDGQVYRQVYGQVGSQVAAQVAAQVGAQVSRQVYGQVDGQVAGQVRDQVHRQVVGQVYGQVGSQVVAQVGDQVYGQVYGQVDGQVLDQVAGQVDRQVRDQVRRQVRDQVRRQVGEQAVGRVVGQVRDQMNRWRDAVMYGQHTAAYYSYYSALEAVGVTGLEPLHGQILVAKSAGWWWAFKDHAVVTPRPVTLHLDADGRLHNSDGMAITYPDGWGLWCWHGRRVPAWVITNPTANAIAAEDNVEIRRCAIESLGWDRFVTEASLRRCAAPVPDPGNPGQLLHLYDVPERLWGGRIRLLMCTNGSAERSGERRRYGLTVPAHIDDPLEAAAWTAGLSRDQYALMQRRT